MCPGQVRLFKDLFPILLPSSLAGINLCNCICLLFPCYIRQELLQRLDVESHFENSSFGKISMNRDHSQVLYTYWQQNYQSIFLETLGCSSLYIYPSRCKGENEAKGGRQNQLLIWWVTKTNKNSANVTMSEISADKGACQQPDNLNLVPRPHMVENKSPLIACSTYYVYTCKT